MNFKKLFSALTVAAMITTSYASIASAATFDWSTDDEVYYVSGVNDLSDREPVLETSVKKLTSSEVVALKPASGNPTCGLSKLKLATGAGKYSDTSSWSVYEVTLTVKNVGDLCCGYDSNGDSAWVKVAGFKIPMDIAGTVFETGTKGTNYDLGVDSTTVDPFLGFGNQAVTDVNKTTKLLNISFATTVAADFMPKEDTAKDGFLNLDYSAGKIYFVLKADQAPITIKYASTAGVIYNCLNVADDSFANQNIDVPFKTAAEFTLGASGAEQTVTFASQSKENASKTVGTDNFYFAKTNVTWDMDNLSNYYVKATDTASNTKEWKLFSPETSVGAKDGFVNNSYGKLEQSIIKSEFDGTASFYITVKATNERVINKVEIIKK